MHAFYREQPRDLPVAGEYDVIVAGSGPAGVSAAIHAGRLGARVLLLEINKGAAHARGKLWHNMGRYAYVLCAAILCAVALFMKVAF